MISSDVSTLKEKCEEEVFLFVASLLLEARYPIELVRSALLNEAGKLLGKHDDEPR